MNELEQGDVLQSRRPTVVFLDASVQGGGCSYPAVDFRDSDFPAAGDRVYAPSEAVRRSWGDAASLEFLRDLRPDGRRLCNIRIPF